MLGLPNLETVVSNFLESGSGITALRSVEWDKKYLWVVDFKGSYIPPAPFDKFFPANSITAPFSYLESETLDLPQTTMHYPKRQHETDLQITFYDDEQRTLLRWLTDWQKLDILNYGNFVSGLGDSHQVVGSDSFGNGTRSVAPVRQVRFALIDAYRDEVLVKNYWVYPDGDISYLGGQESAAQMYTVNFKIVKVDLDNSPAQSAGLLSVAGIKSIIGRFV
jgi:hypothetical protein